MVGRARHGAARVRRGQTRTLIAQPLICVADVVASSRWYCTLLGGTSGHGGTEYERIMIGDTFYTVVPASPPE